MGQKRDYAHRAAGCIPLVSPNTFHAILTTRFQGTTNVECCVSGKLSSRIGMATSSNLKKEAGRIEDRRIATPPPKKKTHA